MLLATAPTVTKYERRVAAESPPGASGVRRAMASPAANPISVWVRLSNGRIVP